MFTETETLRDIGMNHGWMVCLEAADWIETLEARVAELENHTNHGSTLESLKEACAQVDHYREALEQIRDATVACNGGLLQSVHAIAQLATDPDGCRDLARIKDA